MKMAHSSSHSERSIHEMLKDAPPMNESNSAIQSGIEGRVKHPPRDLHIRTNSGKYVEQCFCLCFEIFTFELTVSQ